MNLPTYNLVKQNLREKPKKWLVTGAAGFIGSHLVEALIKLNQRVIGLDNFSTGYKHNLDQALENAELALKAESCQLNTDNFIFIEGDITKLKDCRKAIECQNNPGSSNLEPQNEVVDFVLHQAALGSVPNSIEDPINSNESNVTGFLNMLVATRDAGVKRFVYAASSSTYGDSQALPKIEDVIGKPLSPYAVTKLLNEIYADVFAQCYGAESIGLRYFNVFGPRQDPNGAYAAVIPRWAAAILKGEAVEIYGDGETSRDFCYIDNVIQANILAATTENPEATNQVYNVALGERTTLNQLYNLISEKTAVQCKLSTDNSNPTADCLLPTETLEPTENLVYKNFRFGDVRHSQADITKARTLLGYTPTHTFEHGLAESIKWYANNL